MTKTFSRRQLREKAFQALLAIEFGTDSLEAAQFAYHHEDDEAELKDLSQDLPIFLLNLIQGVASHQEELDQLLVPYLKSGWTLDRLTLVDKILLRLGLFEIKFFEETPDKVALNEAIELAKTFSDAQSARFINGVLTKFINE